MKNLKKLYKYDPFPYPIKESIKYDREKANEMLNKGIYCYKYRIKMSDPNACLKFTKLWIAGAGFIYDECRKCPTFQHILNISKRRDG